MARYKDKKVVILGGTSGMWLATAKMLLAEGARVLLTGRSPAGLESARQELRPDAIVVSSDARSSTNLTASSLNSRLNFLRCIDALRSMKAPYLGVHQTGSSSPAGCC